MYQKKKFSIGGKTAFFNFTHTDINTRKRKENTYTHTNTHTHTHREMFYISINNYDYAAKSLSSTIV